jgi:hypothetical protein
VLDDRVALVFYVLKDPETRKHVIVFVKKMFELRTRKNVNKFKDVQLFINLINIKHIKKYFDKNLISYM